MGVWRRSWEAWTPSLLLKARNLSHLGQVCFPGRGFSHLQSRTISLRSLLSPMQLDLKGFSAILQCVGGETHNFITHQLYI